jgi:Arc/MetJ-type ribon-helix-helix transcriptional regulator
MTTTVTIPPHHEEFIRQRIASGRNRDALSVVAEALYLHDARQRLRPFEICTASWRRYGYG